jgi:hypothetical protein
MPTVFRDNGIRFFFFSNEENPREPLHIHARAPGAEAKLWLYPRVRVAYNAGFNELTLTRIVRTVAEHREMIREAWHEHFG